MAWKHDLKTWLGNITWKHVIIWKHQNLRRNLTSVGNWSKSYEKYKVLKPKKYGHFGISVFRKLCILSAETLRSTKLPSSFDNSSSFRKTTVYFQFGPYTLWIKKCHQNPVICHMDPLFAGVDRSGTEIPVYFVEPLIYWIKGYFKFRIIRIIWFKMILKKTKASWSIDFDKKGVHY